MLRSFSLPAFLVVIFLVSGNSQPNATSSQELTGFAHSEEEQALETKFLAVPDPNLAREHLRILTQAPHVAGTPEDKANAEYVAQKFRDAGLETRIVEYEVWINYPKEISVDVTAPPLVHMHGPTREHVDGDPYQDDPRVFIPFTGMSPSGDVTAEVVYANYGTPADFQKLADLKIDVRGKIVIARYGQNYRGVKADLAHQHGAVGLILYSDPADDGRARGAVYRDGPWRPDTGVQRGSINAIWEFPGDVTTPGIIGSESARLQKNQAGKFRCHGENSDDATLFRGRDSDSATSRRAGSAQRLDRKLAVQLSHRTRAGARETAPEAGL